MKLKYDGMKIEEWRLRYLVMNALGSVSPIRAFFNFRYTVQEALVKEFKKEKLLAPDSCPDCDRMNYRQVEFGPELKCEKHLFEELEKK